MKWILDGEAPLTFDILVTMDGNDSLKRIQKRARVAEDLVEGEEASVGESNERIDTYCGDVYGGNRNRCVTVPE
jgi:hypothetical protein